MASLISSSFGGRYRLNLDVGDLGPVRRQRIVGRHTSQALVRAGHGSFRDELVARHPCRVVRRRVGPDKVGSGVAVDLAEYLDQLARLLRLRLLLSAL